MSARTLLSLLALAGAASLTAPAPAGACSIFCPGEQRSLVLVEVALVDGDAAAEAPDWSLTATLDASSDGTPYALSFADQTMIDLLPAGVP